MKTYKNYNQIAIGLIVFAVAVFGIILISVPKTASAYYVKGYYTVSDSQNNTNTNNNGSSGYNENATPILTRISPSTINQNTARSIDVYGNYFSPNSVVKINGANKPTNFISENHLVTYLNQSDTAYTGEHLVSVVNSKTGAQSNARILKVVKPTTTTAKKTGTVKKATLVRANTQTTTIPEDKILIVADRGTELYYLDQSSDYDNGDNINQDNTLAANSFFSTGGFMPSTFLQWIVLFILILLCVFLWRKIYVTDAEKNAPLKHH